MAVDITQLNTDVAAAQSALDTLAAHFAADPSYYSGQLTAIERARDSVRQVADETRGGVNAK